MVLYNDRVFAFKEQAEINKRWENNEPTNEEIESMIDCDERNILCFSELQNYNDRGNFLYQHPLTVKYKRECDLDKLRRTNPQEFLNKLKNIKNNVTRYRSQIRNAKYRDDEELANWNKIIEENLETIEYIERLISQ